VASDLGAGADGAKDGQAVGHAVCACG
jgi:hypothetical protein